MDRLQNIETFVRVAQTQNFTEAARQLRVARSVVSTRIQQLEEYPLFHRSTRVVRLTEMGRAFQRDCSELVACANDVVGDHDSWYLLGLGLLAIVMTICFKQGLWGFAQQRWGWRLFPTARVLKSSTAHMEKPCKTPTKSA
ncbi:LysR family transcriptional regulator [Verminephrobacter eiseniae]|uniref:LysR family transcriptional regulator n=1 Tax=Verminephrobacter eiseniae TaxID=364317 RepID=UPI0038B2B6F8|nr:LysR family transcriptional regulator [Verminephrobacter eiseniae]